MEKKIITEIEIFKTLASKYGTGEQSAMKLTGFRNTCEVMTVKIFPEDRNSNGKNKAALVFHKDEKNFSILFYEALPQNSNKDRILIEITTPTHPEKPTDAVEPGDANYSFGERSGIIPRVLRTRSSHDKFEVMVRIVASEILKDHMLLTHSLPFEKERALIRETQAV